MHCFAVAALTATLLMSGCSPYVNRGETLYREGRYIEAAEVFELTETKLKQSSSEICAEYGLYRGLTYLKLNDLRNARLWLAYAYGVEQHEPGQLTSDEHVLLDHGWKELERREKTQGPEAPTQVAASEARAAGVGSGASGNGQRVVDTE